MSRRAKKKLTIVKLILLIAVLGGIYSIMGSAMLWILPAIILLVVFLPKILPVLVSSVGYYNTEYYNITKKPLLKLWFDKGAYGEYMIYRYMDKKIEGEHQWLFNAYLPRSQNRTTEIDVILFHSSGIYIFESKNYKGWIFGSESRKVWTQCIKPAKDVRVHKYRFLNPIMQNKLHVACLKQLLNEEQAALPIHSIVLFGNRCKLKNIQLSSGLHHVVTLNELPDVIQDIFATSQHCNYARMHPLYNMLYPMTQVSDEVKQKHIADIEAEILADAEAVLDGQDMPPVTVEEKSAALNDIERQEEPPRAELPREDASQKEQMAVPRADNLRISSDSFSEKAVTTDPVAARTHRGKPCPWCGATLVRLTAKKGVNAGKTFVGCSNYPNCRYTKSLDDKNT